MIATKSLTSRSRDACAGESDEVLAFLYLFGKDLSLSFD